MKKTRSQIGVCLYDQPTKICSGINPQCQKSIFNIYGWDEEDFLVADIFLLGKWHHLKFRLVSYGGGDECWEADLDKKAIYIHLVDRKITLEVDE